MNVIKVVADSAGPCVLCTLNNGTELEIEMIEVAGSKVRATADIDTAVKLVNTHFDAQVYRQCAGAKPLGSL